MRTIYLLGCSKRKAERPCAAEHLYQGDLFAKSLAYARLHALDENIRVLSARYHVVRLHQKLGVYDETLNRMSARKRRAWGAAVTHALSIQFGTAVKGGGIWPPMGGVHFVILAGRKYRDVITGMIEASESTWEAPMAGLGIGEQLAWLKEELRRTT